MENTNRNLASPILRVLAYLIDFALGMLPGIWFINFVSGSSDLALLLDRSKTIIYFFFYPISYSFITAFMISKFGGTLGKLLTGTKIVTQNGSNLSFWKAFFRNHIGYMISGILLWLGFIWVFIDKERRGWHDQISDSYVVVKNGWTSALGVAVLILLIVFELNLVKTVMLNVRTNPQVYTDLVDTVKANFNDLDASSIKTDNWQTFDSAYGYSIKYPEGWVAAGPNGADPTLFNDPVFNSPCNYDQGALCMQMFISSVPYGPGTDPEMTYETIDETNKFAPNFIINADDKIENIKDFTVDGVPARGFDYFQSHHAGTRWQYVVVFDRANVRYTITYEEQQKDKGVITPSDWKNKETFDKIVSTFKFSK